MRLRRQTQQPEPATPATDPKRRKQIEDLVDRAKGGNREALDELFNHSTALLVQDDFSLRELVRTTREGLESERRSLARRQDVQCCFLRWAEASEPADQFSVFASLLWSLEQCTADEVRELTREAGFDLEATAHDMRMHLHEQGSQLLEKLENLEDKTMDHQLVDQWRRLSGNGSRIEGYNIELEAEGLKRRWDELVARRIYAPQPDDFSETYHAWNAGEPMVDAATALADDDIVGVAKLLAYAWARDAKLPDVTLHELAMKLVELRKRDQHL